jgi:argininosuccinate synthase
MHAGIPVVQTASSPYSIDENLFGRAIEAGVLEDPWNAPPDEPYALTFDPSTAPAPIEVTVGFERGLPVSLDGEELARRADHARANHLAGAYGIGRIDMIENRCRDQEPRVYEAPGAIMLITARRSRTSFSRRTRRGSSGRSSSAGRRSSTRVAGSAPRARRSTPSSTRRRSS